MPQIQVNSQDNFADLIEEMRVKNATGEGPAAPPAHKPMLDSLDDFERVSRHAIQALMEEQEVTPELVARIRKNRHQMLGSLWAPHAAGYINQVTDGAWFAMIQTAIKTKLRDLTHRRSGKWVLIYADWNTIFKHYTDKRGKFVGQEGKQEERTVSRRERHFYLPMVFGEVTGAAPLTYSEVDGTVVTGMRNMDPALAQAMQDIAANAGSNGKATVAYESDNAELRDRLARLEAALLAATTPTAPAPAAAAAANGGEDNPVAPDPLAEFRRQLDGSPSKVPIRKPQRGKS
ncbi:MAG TPA: hypothetical protein VI911_04270 [Patescibacteria group bacterium]|nr:hypothetical protein [Patescibacteria group bacterium]